VPQRVPPERVVGKDRARVGLAQRQAEGAGAVGVAREDAIKGDGAARLLRRAAEQAG
jgi:hypothetical protein